MFTKFNSMYYFSTNYWL